MHRNADVLFSSEYSSHTLILLVIINTCFPALFIYRFICFTLSEDYHFVMRASVEYRKLSCIQTCDHHLRQSYIYNWLGRWCLSVESVSFFCAIKTSPSRSRRLLLFKESVDAVLIWGQSPCTISTIVQAFSQHLLTCATRVGMSEKERK